MTTMMHPTTEQALDLFESVLSSIDHRQRAGMAADELVRLMVRARKLRDRVDTLACVLTDEVRQGEAALCATGAPITTLVGATEHQDARQAAADVFTAAAVSAHEATKHAALAGTFSPKHAAAINAVLTELPAELDSDRLAQAEQILIQRATEQTPRQVAKLGPSVLAEVAPELMPSRDDLARKAELEHRQAIKKRSLSYGDDGAGSTWFKGSLPHADAAPLVAMIDSYVESDRRAERDDHAGMKKLAAAPWIVRDHTTTTLARTPEQRRADALVALVSDHRRAPSVAGDRPRIVVTITEADLREHAIARGIIGRDTVINARDLRQLCCDADIMPVVLGTKSEILDVGRTHRLATPAIRKALSLAARSRVATNPTPAARRTTSSPGKTAGQQP